MKKIAITTGDPAGIGAEITAKSLKYRKTDKNIIYIIYGENYRDMLETEIIESPVQAKSYEKIYQIPIKNTISTKGKPSSESGQTAYEILKICSQHLTNHLIDAVVTAPVSKEYIQITHPEFVGHTEFFARQMNINDNDVIMSFWSDTFNLALLTTHLSVTDAISKLTFDFIYNKLKKIIFEVKKIIKHPKIAILGINPHAGENGKFGNSDLIVTEVLKKLSKENILIDGPFPADSFFAVKYTQYHLIISALHDQGLIPFKLLNFGQGINVTLGLPFVRTSPDHGTAFDIADQDIADESSMKKALDFAEFLLFKNKYTHNTYSHFAKYYDNYMEHVDYDTWIKFILDKYKQFSSFPLETIFEMACGTANISVRLVEKGYKVYAGDNSEDMLKQAEKKQNKPLLFNSDFLEPLPKKNIDLILLIFDSINYISDTRDISKLFSNVYNALKYNGIFIFDISTIKNCQDNFDGFVNLEDSPQSYFIHESNLSDNKLISKLTFFEKYGYLYKRFDEIHTQNIYKIKTIVDLINKSELTLKGLFSNSQPNINLLSSPLSTEEMDYDYERIFFVLKKEI
jgi:4-hydroxythreonine-4-phosphate dehydrogenase